MGRDDSISTLNLARDSNILEPDSDVGSLRSNVIGLYGAGRGKYFQVVDAVFAAQSQIATEGGPTETLAHIARDAGLSAAQFTACLEDKAALAALQARVDRHEKQDGVTGTPTFVIAGRKLEGEQSVDELGTTIAAAPRR